MKKKIKISQLKPGMYISDFNCDWRNRPFFSNSMKVEDNETVDKIIEYKIEELFIDTEKGIDVTSEPASGANDNKNSGRDFNGSSKSGIRKSDPVPLNEEIQVAQVIKEEAKQAIEDAMEDARLGRQISVKKIDSLVDKMVDSISRNKNALSALGRIKTVDQYTFQHSVSVGILMVSFAMHLDYDYETVKALGIGGLLHDIGKVKIPESILNKPAMLTNDEFEEIKKHVTYGCEILSQTPDINEKSVAVVELHHERLGGHGYLEGLKEDEIGPYGQMAAIVDVYDAITSNRCYHDATLPTNALRKIYGWSENNFNLDLVHQFICCIGIYPVGTLVRLENDMLGVVTRSGDKDLLYPTVRLAYDMRKEEHIIPADTDLSVNLEEKVISCECPEKWGINTEKYLGLEAQVIK